MIPKLFEYSYFQPKGPSLKMRLMADKTKIKHNKFSAAIEYDFQSRQNPKYQSISQSSLINLLSYNNMDGVYELQLHQPPWFPSFANRRDIVSLF